MIIVENNSGYNLIRLVGLALFLDDINDFPRLDRLHHWQIGVVCLLKPDWIVRLLAWIFN